MPTTPPARPTRRRLARPEAPVPQVPTIPLDVPIYRYRVLFSDGHTVDFLAPSDHSGYREMMLDAHFPNRPKKAHGDVQHRIEGIAHLGQVYVHMPQVNWPEPPSPQDAT